MSFATKATLSENTLLSRATLITALGDWLTYFGIIKFVHIETQSAILAAYMIPVRVLATGLAAYSGPKLLAMFSTRRLMISSMQIAFVVGIIFAMSVFLKAPNQIYIAIAVTVILTFCKFFFDASRESHSKGLASEASQQRSLQAELLNGFYAAQVFGPLVAMILIATIPLWVLFFFDALTFLFASSLCRRTTEQPFVGDSTRKKSIFAPLGYMPVDSGLRTIFLVRSIGFWIPISISNFIVFIVLTERFDVGIEKAAWIYSLSGLGSICSSLWLCQHRGDALLGLGKLSDARIASAALAVYALGTILFAIKLPIFFAVFAFLIAGIGNGGNAVATQSLRRKLTTDAQFSEVLALETIVARITDWSVSSLVAILYAKGILSLGFILWIIPLLLLLLSAAMWRKEIREL